MFRKPVLAAGVVACSAVGLLAATAPSASAVGVTANCVRHPNYPISVCIERVGNVVRAAGSGSIDGQTMRLTIQGMFLGGPFSGPVDSDSGYAEAEVQIAGAGEYRASWEGAKYGIVSSVSVD